MRLARRVDELEDAMERTSALRWGAIPMGLAVLGVTATTGLGAPATAAPAGGSWSPTAGMGVAHTQQTATLLRGGGVLVTGGSSSPAAEIWRARTGWTGAGSMAIDRSGATATRLPDGRVLVAGGCTGGYCAGVASSAELYDPARGTWTPTAPMPTAHGYATATLLRSGQVLVAGGRGSGQNPLASAERYQPASRSWTATPSMHSARSFATATSLADGRVLVTGGGTGTAELYAP